jgi:4-diphosphocytidyl-2-C-methyl-D-erythritol kinase
VSARDTGRSLEAEAPAKLNLGLRVRARRADGYHEIESVFAPIDLADRVRLRVSEAETTRVTLTLRGASPDVPEDARNLAVRAAEGFLAAAGLSLAVEIQLHKHIPSGAGLGGGSSDAGAVLRLLSGARPGALAPAQLEALALELGADVPFFLDPRPAWVTGVGEQRSPLPGLPPFALLLVNPGVRLETLEVYRAFDALTPDPGAGPPLPDPAGDWRDEPLAARLRNDLEPAALRLCPEIRRLRAALEARGPRAVALSGSGPTLYGVFADAATAERARRALPAAVWTRVAAIPEAR